MADNESKNIALNKRVTSNKHSNASLNKNFKKLAKSGDPINPDRIKNSYNDLFYDISKKGKLSHNQIIEQSYNHVFYRLNQTLDNKIDSYLYELDEWNNKLTDSQLPKTNEHSVYDDGSFLMAGESPDQEPYQDMHTVWVMQEGKKRPIADVNVYNTIRRSYGLEEGATTGIYYLTVEELNLITDGTPIHIYSDLNLEGNSLITEDVDIELTSAYYEVSFYCEGNEVQDVYNVILNDNGASQGQFIVNNEGCKIKFLVDNGTVDDVLPEVVEVQFNKGEQIIQKFVRETFSFNNSGFPTNIQDIYSQNSPGEITYTNQSNISALDFDIPISDYIREWGPMGKFTGIVYAEGRINYRELKPSEETESHILNGLPSSPQMGSFWQVVNLDDLNQTTPSGTNRLFRPGSNLYGALNQDSDLQSYFEDLNFSYYMKQINVGNIYLDLSYLGGFVNFFTGDSIHVGGGIYPCYGQPIIRYDQRYNIVLTIRKKSWDIASIDVGSQEWFVLYDLTGNRGVYTRRRRDLKNAGINLDMGFSSSGPDRIKWENATPSKIKFIGLKGYGTTGYNTTGVGNDNPFNPNNGGSNYQINSYNTL